MATKIDSLRLEPADNGFRVCWCESTPMKGGGTYSNMSYQSHDEVFKDAESKKAMARFMELRNKMKGISNDEEEEEGE